MKKLRVADLFCGAGGTSTAACSAAVALGFEPELTAINHWPVAVATHAQNHPDARHLCTSIDNVDPRKLFRPGELDLLWASPECTHHSVARGGKPIHDQSRATAWCVVRWADALRPPIILVENVPEFETWGPLNAKGRPIPSRKGEVFKAWKANLQALGYRVDHRVLCAADFGDPTTRRRLFVLAVRGKFRIAWPEPSHSPGGGSGTKKWRAAREIIDWTNRGRWIDEMPPQARYGGLPLSPNTFRRIHTGFSKFGGKGFITPNFGERDGQEPRCHSIDDPAPAVTSRGAGNLVEPFLCCHEHGGTVRSIDRPMPTITTAKGGAIALAEPFLIPQRGGSRSIDTPAPTVTTTSRGIAVVEPFLVELRGTSDRQLDSTARSVDAPLPTVSAGGVHAGLVEPFLVQMNHGDGGDPKAAGRRVRSIDAPMATVCGTRGEFALIESALLPQQSDGRLRPVSEPAPTVAAAGAIALVEPYLVEYYGTGGAQSLEDPLNTVTSKDRHALVCPTIEHAGMTWRVRFRYRMLQPGELAGAQGFLGGYLFTGTKTDQVKQIGNAVPYGLARALVMAVLKQK